MEKVADIFSDREWMRLIETLMIMTPAIIAAISSLKNHQEIKSVDKKLVQNSMQHALNQIREKGDGENSRTSSSSQKKAGTSKRKKTLTGSASE